jgi:predicted molibdopterin-dependent oxidoreductase YjgC
MSGRFKRLAEQGRPAVVIQVDGQPVNALEGDTLMVAMLASGTSLRVAEFGPEKRAGFCLMGACQDCWVWTTDGDRLRACSTPVESGLKISTSQPEATWPSLG